MGTYIPVSDLILQNCRLDAGGAPPQPNVNVGEPQYGGVSLLQQMVAGTGRQYIYFYIIRTVVYRYCFIVITTLTRSSYGNHGFASYLLLFKIGGHELGFRNQWRTIATLHTHIHTRTQTHLCIIHINSWDCKRKEVGGLTMLYFSRNTILKSPRCFCPVRLRRAVRR